MVLLSSVIAGTALGSIATKSAAAAIAITPFLINLVILFTVYAPLSI
jgi:hypothetical protein